MASTYSGQKWSVVAKTGNYTAIASDFLILCDTSGGGFTITLPASTDGATYNIKKTSAIGTLTISPQSTELIDGEALLELTDQWVSATLTGYGGDWYII